MAGFGGFGTGGGTPSGGMFGAKPPNQTAGGFTVPTTTATTTTTGLNFGTPSFGTKSDTPLFGTQQQAPAFGSATPNFSFGTNTSIIGSTPLTSTTVPTFGTLGSSDNPTFGASPFNLGAPSTSAPAQFTLPSAAPGTTTTAAPSFNFNLTPSLGTSAPLTFGIPTATTSTGTAPTVSFGLPPSNTTATTTIPTSGFSLAPSTTASGLTFGTAKTTGGFTFGTTAATTTASGGGFTFGATSTAAAATTTTTTGGFTFGTTAAAATTTTTAGGFTFGTTPAATTAKPLFNLTTTTAATTTLSATATTAATSSTSTPTAAPVLFGTPKTSEGVSIKTTTTTTTTSVGLGGVDKAQTTPGLSGAGTTEPKQAKDHNLPDPILQTLNDFQNFTKQQKSISVEISHGSSKPLKKVQEDTEAMESLLTTIMSGLTRNAIAVDKLKTETAQGLHQTEMAQRNNETPPCLDYDNSAPSDYFNDLVTKFENDTVSLRVQIEASEKHLRSLTQSSTISPQELTLAMRRLHETLIVLAARVQSLHTSVQSQKEQFKNLRRVYFKDDTNIFENDQNGIKKQTLYSLRSLTGPTPFSETPVPGLPLNVDGLAMLASTSGPSNPTTSANPCFMSSHLRSPNVEYKKMDFLGNYTSLDIPGFQLSKPPPCNKRSKR